MVDEKEMRNAARRRNGKETKKKLDKKSAML